jgi:hypothetical protein
MIIQRTKRTKIGNAQVEVTIIVFILIIIYLHQNFVDNFTQNYANLYQFVINNSSLLSIFKNEEAFVSQDTHTHTHTQVQSKLLNIENLSDEEEKC